MKAVKKMGVIKELLSEFKTMLKTFVSVEDDEYNVIHIVAQFCSKSPETHDCFHLIMQCLLDNQQNEENELRLLKPKTLLDWLKLTKEKIEKGPQEDPLKEEQKDNSSGPDDSEDKDNQVFSDEYGSDDDDSEEEEIDLDVLQIFCSKMKKFEEILKSLTEVE